MGKKFIAFVLSLALILSFTVSAYAAGPTNELSLVVTSSSLTESDKSFMEKMLSVLDGYITIGDEITFTYSDADLISLGFSSTDIATLDEINRSVCGVVYKAPPDINANTPVPLIHTEGFVIYFDPGEVVDFLFAAATVGPEALYAAFVGLGTLFGGPIGSAITAIAGWLGLASFGGLCYLIIQAVSNGQGIYFGVEFNKGFPNIVSGYWDP